MAHTRIRKFNTSDTYPEQNLDNDLCQAVVTEGGRIVWLRGQCPQNLEDAVNLDSHDPVEQTHKVMQNIKQFDLCTNSHHDNRNVLDYQIQPIEKLADERRDLFSNLDKS